MGAGRAAEGSGDTRRDKDGRRDGDSRRDRGISLIAITIAGTLVAWVAILAIPVAVALAHARAAVREETGSAFALARAAATAALPTDFTGRDLLAEAARTAAMIRAQRHVTAELRDAAGRPLPLPDLVAPADAQAAGPGAASDPSAAAPRGLARLLAPEPQRDLLAITRYPNLLGLLEIRTDPADEIAEVWQDLRVQIPLLSLAALAAGGVTLALSFAVLRALGRIDRALAAMRGSEPRRRAPPTGLREIDRLGRGVNALATHLARERARNRALQARMMTLAEAERARIASDLHDGIGPALFALRAAVAQLGVLTGGPAPAPRQPGGADERAPGDDPTVPGAGGAAAPAGCPARPAQDAGPGKAAPQPLPAQPLPAQPFPPQPLRPHPFPARSVPAPPFPAQSIPAQSIPARPAVLAAPVPGPAAPSALPFAQGELAETIEAVARHAQAIGQAARATIDALGLGLDPAASLAEAIEELLCEFRGIAPAARLVLESAPDLPCPDEAARIAICRFVRESVLNALRHGGARQVEVMLTARGAELVARVEDDGAGPSPGARRGLGLRGIGHRAALVGARWQPPRHSAGRTITELGVTCP